MLFFYQSYSASLQRSTIGPSSLQVPTAFRNTDIRLVPAMLIRSWKRTVSLNRTSSWWLTMMLPTIPKILSLENFSTSLSAKMSLLAVTLITRENQLPQQTSWTSSRVTLKEYKVETVKSLSPHLIPKYSSILLGMVNKVILPSPTRISSLDELNANLNYMHYYKMYGELVFYIEAC